MTVEDDKGALGVEAGSIEDLMPAGAVPQSRRLHKRPNGLIMGT
jgi:hypothetical protein